MEKWTHIWLPVPPAYRWPWTEPWFSTAEQRLWLTLLAKNTFNLTRGAKLQDGWTAWLHLAGLLQPRGESFPLRTQWNQMTNSKFFSITRPFTTLNCCSLPVAFSISSAGLQITQRMSSAVVLLPCCLFSFLFSISCKRREKECIFLPHGSRSHNLIHLCDKLHYKGSQWCTALLIRPRTESQPQPVTCAHTYTHTYPNIFPQLNPVPQQKAW